MRKPALLAVASLLLAVAPAAPALAANAQHSPRPAAAVAQHPNHRACAMSTKKDVASCMALVRDDVATPKSAITPYATPSGYGPSQLQSAYKLNTAGGSGLTVAIVDAYDLPTAASDLNTYRTQYGLPSCTTSNGCFRKVNQSGGTTPPTADAGWGQEIALDLDMVSAACPNCKILLVEANSSSMTDLGASVNTAVSLGANAVSNSYGGSESSSDTSYDSSYFNHPGVAITVSSGDSGYGPEYPAASQYVTAVGGTSLSTASNTRGWTESAWSGAGSGCSSYDAMPSWQNSTTTGCSRRAEADVSSVADPNTGVAVYDSTANGGQSGWMVFGGTSASSPFIAGVYMLAGAPAAGTYPASYPWAHTTSLFDVTSGSNGSCSPSQLCTARTGWDGPTGWGTPNGSAAFTSGGGGGGGGSSNLAVNGGFESGTSSWTAWPGTNFVVYQSGQVAGEAARSGQYYAATNTSQSGGSIYQDIPVSAVAGNVYCASAWVRTQYPSTGASGTFVLWLTGGASTENGSTAFTGLSNGANWQQVQTCVSATTSHTQLRVQFYPTVNGPTVDVDDVDAHVSLATNAGFESGTSSWTAWPGTNFVVYQSGQVAGEAARSGQYYAATNTSQSGGSIYQDIPVSAVAGNVYCASAWVRTQYPSTGASGTFVLWLIGGASTENGSTAFTGLSNGANWQQVRTCVSATTSHTQLRVQFYPTVNGPTVDIDDVDVH